MVSPPMVGVKKASKFQMTSLKDSKGEVSSVSAFSERKKRSALVSFYGGNLVYGHFFPRPFCSENKEIVFGFTPLLVQSTVSYFHCLHLIQYGY